MSFQMRLLSILVVRDVPVRRVQARALHQLASENGLSAASVDHPLIESISRAPAALNGASALTIARRLFPVSL